MKDKIRSLVIENLGLEPDIADDTLLFSSGLLDSLSAVSLLFSLNDDLGITLSPLDVALDDFDSIELIVATVEKYS
ncbi:MAG: acyl carrier protein [Acidimicrobiales bacterium]|nr:acyl carrier protein [Acidimicrobiales bacterium]